MCKKQRNLTILLLLALCCVSGWSLLAGLVPISPAHVLHGELTLLEKSVLEHLRLPRLLLGLGTGAALATSGAVLQGVFGNPLADPGILGVSSGAALGAVITLLFGLPQLHFMWLPLGAFCGALLACACVAFLGRGGQDNRLKLLLSGVAVSLFCGALTAGLLSFAPDAVMRQYFFWTLGSLSSGSWLQVRGILPILLCSLCMVFLWGRQLNVLSLGEEQALSLGLAAPKWRKLLLGLTSLVMALGVCAGGNIGFVGLIVPHMLRLVLGPDHRVLLPMSALGGAVFLAFCDALGRVILPGSEIRVGIITALCGTPYFLFLLRKK